MMWFNVNLILDLSKRSPRKLNYFVKIKDVCMLSHFSRVLLFDTLWTVAHHSPLSMGFSRQEYWTESLCPPPGDIPNHIIKPIPLISPALTGGFFTASAIWETWLTRESTKMDLSLPLGRVDFLKDGFTPNLWGGGQCRKQRKGIHCSPLTPAAWNHTLPLLCLGDPIMDVVYNRHNALCNHHFD